MLNSSGYWKKKLERRRCTLEGRPFRKPREKKRHEYPSSRKMTWLDKIDYHLVDYFGNQCEVRSLDFFLWWGTKTEHKTFGKLAKRLYAWFTNYYAGFMVPVSGSLGRGVEVMPYEHIVELVKRAKVGQIWPCSCKSFRQADEGIPRATCMLIAEVASLDDSMTKYPDMGFMPAEEVLRKLKEFEDIGLVHQIMCVSSPQGRKMYVLCNCDNKACVPMYLKCRYGVPMVKASGFVCEIGDLSLCMRCENAHPYYLRKKINEARETNVLFTAGAIASINAGGYNSDDRFERTVLQGETLAAAALSIDNDEPLEPGITVLCQPYYSPIDNGVLALMGLIKTINAEKYPCGRGDLGFALQSELTYIRLGKQPILLIPGEMKPELAFGGYAPAETSATGLGAEINPPPLCEIAGDENLLVFGVTNDMTGYIIAPNDFMLHQTAPYLDKGKGRHGSNHYHETNSLGFLTAETIADTFSKMMGRV